MIWCVEDDASIRDIEVYALQSTGFEAKGFEDGQEFWNALQEEMPELVVLDVMLPGLDGITLLRRMKSSPALSSIPVVMATAKGAEYDKIQGLDLGADYYLTKPFGVMELVSCVKAVLRRCQMQAPAHLLQSGGILVDLDAHTVTANGQRVELTFKEIRPILRMFGNLFNQRLLDLVKILVDSIVRALDPFGKARIALDKRVDAVCDHRDGRARHLLEKAVVFALPSVQKQDDLRDVLGLIADALHVRDHFQSCRNLAQIARGRYCRPVF